MKTFTWHLMALLITASFYAVGQSSTVYAVPEGLPSSEVYQVFQDSRGFLWFCTDNGVARFDGRNIETFHVKDGLVDPVVFGITEDYKGRLWFRSYSGRVSYFENEKINTYAYNEILSSLSKNSLMSSLVCDSTDRLWFGVGNIMGSIDKDGKLDTLSLRPFTFSTRDIGAHLIHAYTGPTYKIDKYESKGNQYPFVKTDSIFRYHVLCAARWNGLLYLTNNNHIYQFDGKHTKLLKLLPAAVISLTVDRNNSLWIGYMNHGAERYDTDLSKPDLELYRERSVTSALEDHEGGIWLSTLENGVTYVPNWRIETFRPKNYGNVKTTWSDNEEVVIGDTKGQLTVYDADNKRILWTRNFTAPVISLFRPRNRNLWVATTERVDIFNAGYQLIGSIPFSRQHFLEKANGDVMTITGSRIAEYDGVGNYIKYRDIPKIYRVLLIHGTDTIAAGRNGLDYVNSKFEVIESPAGFENVKISGLLPVSDSTFLVTTIGNGFYIVNKRTSQSKQYNTVRGFITDNIYTVIQLDQNFWFGTDKGLAKISKSDLASGNFHFDHLTKSSGLLENKISHLAGSASTLWVLTDNGITLVPTRGTRFAHKEPKFVLNGVTVNDEKTAFLSNRILPSQANNIQFDYRSITFNNPEIQFRSRVLDSEPWVYSNNLKLSYPSLAPAEYALNIQYTLDNVNWVPIGKAVHFTIDQPWFAKWYVIALLFIVICGLGYWYVRYQRSIFKQKNLYLSIINEHQQKLIQSEIVTVERERNRISKELHDRVGTNLTAIKMTVNQILKSYKEPKAEEIEQQLQEAIREIKEIIYALTPPSLERYGLFTSLKNYVGKLNKSIPINFSLKTFGNEIKDSDLNIILFRVIQELLTNSIKHSFAKNITIHINSFDDVLNIMYEDDGIGFSYDPLQSGLGLDNIESRIRSVNGTLKFDSGKFGISYHIDIPIKTKKEVA